MVVQKIDIPIQIDVTPTLTHDLFDQSMYIVFIDHKIRVQIVTGICLGNAAGKHAKKYVNTFLTECRIATEITARNEGAVVHEVSRHRPVENGDCRSRDFQIIDRPGTSQDESPCLDLDSRCNACDIERARIRFRNSPGADDVRCDRRRYFSLHRDIARGDRQSVIFQYVTGLKGKGIDRSRRFQIDRSYGRTRLEDNIVSRCFVVRR